MHSTSFNYHTLLPFLGLFIWNTASGQTHQEDSLVLLTVIREFHKTAPIVYVDSVKYSSNGIARFAEKIKGGRIKDIAHRDGNHALTLTAKEQQYLLEQLAITTVWQNHLFADSKRIDDDSLPQYVNIQRRQRLAKMNELALRGDTLHYNQIKRTYPYVFTFTKPIYLRNNTLCFIAWSAICGGECGHDEENFTSGKTRHGPNG